MELVTEPETYTPSVNDLGNYIDVIPPFNNLKHGMRCPCGSRKGKSYNTHSLFAAHIRTKTHQTWMCNLTLNKANFYIECENFKNILKDQKIIIARLDTELQNKTMTIDYLTKQLMGYESKPVVTTDLLSFD